MNTKKYCEFPDCSQYEIVSYNIVDEQTVFVVYKSEDNSIEELWLPIDFLK